MIEINTENLSQEDYEVMIKSLQRYLNQLKTDVKTYRHANRLLLGIIKNYPEAYRYYLECVGLSTTHEGESND